MNDKECKKPGIAMACYVVAAVLFIYAFYSIGSTIAYLNSYFAQYGLTIGSQLGEALNYILSAALQPLTMAILIFMAGRILEAARSQNPAYYVSAEELAAEKAAKAAKKEAAKAAKAAAAEEKAEVLSENVEVADVAEAEADESEDAIEEN